MPEQENEDVVKTSGSVTDVFGHRFVVRTSKGKILADIGPKGAEVISLSAGDKVEIEGEQKSTEIKVQRISVAGGAMRETVHGITKKKDLNADNDESFSAEQAIEIATSEGYIISGKPRPQKKHFEAVAVKGGKSFEIHIHHHGIKVQRGKSKMLG